MNQSITALRFKDVVEKTKLSQSTIYRLIRKNEFPKPIALRGMEKVRLFVKGEVEDWIEKQIATCRIA